MVAGTDPLAKKWKCLVNKNSPNGSFLADPFAPYFASLWLFQCLQAVSEVVVSDKGLNAYSMRRHAEVQVPARYLGRQPAASTRGADARINKRQLAGDWGDTRSGTKSVSCDSRTSNIARAIGNQLQNQGQSRSTPSAYLATSWNIYRCPPPLGLPLQVPAQKQEVVTEEKSRCWELILDNGMGWSRMCIAQVGMLRDGS